VLSSAAAVRRVFSVLFWTFFAVTTVVNFVIAVLLWVLTLPFDRDRRVNHLFSCAWAWMYAAVYPGWHVRTLHRERIAPGRAYVLVANHTSIADIVLLFTLFRQFKWVSKRSVFNAPFLGWNMYLSSYIPLVRGDADSIRQMLDACRRWLRRGVSVMMFPEGTRSEDGTLRPFKRGAFQLSRELGVPVVPIGIHGGHQLIPKHGTTFATSASLAVEVLEPVSPEGFTSDEAYADAVREILRDALTRTP